MSNSVFILGCGEYSYQYNIAVMSNEVEARKLSILDEDRWVEGPYHTEVEKPVSGDKKFEYKWNPTKGESVKEIEVGMRDLKIGSAHYSRFGDFTIENFDKDIDTFRTNCLKLANKLQNIRAAFWSYDTYVTPEYKTYFDDFENPRFIKIYDVGGFPVIPADSTVEYVVESAGVSTYWTKAVVEKGYTDEDFFYPRDIESRYREDVKYYVYEVLIKKGVLKHTRISERPKKFKGSVEVVEGSKKLVLSEIDGSYNFMNRDAVCGYASSAKEFEQKAFDLLKKFMSGRCTEKGDLDEGLNPC